MAKYALCLAETVRVSGANRDEVFPTAANRRPNDASPSKIEQLRTQSRVLRKRIYPSHVHFKNITT